MAAGVNTYKNSDGKSVDVQLSYTVVRDRIAYIQGWLGVTAGAGDSDDYIALRVDDQEYQVDVGSLSISKGANLYIDTADLTGHYPDSTAFGTSAGAGKFIFGKTTSEKDGNNIVKVKMIAAGQLLS